MKNENNFHGCKDTKFFGDEGRGMGIFFRDEVRGESLELRGERWERREMGDERGEVRD